MKAKIDLHMHSHYSDGELSPEKLVKECKKLGLEIISLTDHETVWGVEETIKAGKNRVFRLSRELNFPAIFRNRNSIFWVILLMDSANSPRAIKTLNFWNFSKRWEENVGKDF